MSLRAFDSFKEYADEVAREVLRKQEMILERQRDIAGLGKLYANVRHRADAATWLDATGILLEFAQRGDLDGFFDLARNYGVLDINALWSATRKAFGL